MERWSRLALAGGGLLWLAAAFLPNFAGPADQRLFARVFIFGLLAISLNILLGNAGIVSFGHGLFYGVGSYTVSLLWLHQGWSTLAAVFLAPLVAAGVGAIGGLIAFRARRLYFGLLTLAISQFGFVLATQWYSMTQGENGIHSVELPDWLLTTSARYWFVFGVFSAAVVLIRILVASPFGTTLRAIRENRERVAFLGLNPIRYEYAAFVISAAFAGLAGSLLVVLDQNSFPQLFHWTTSAEPLLMIVIGGSGAFLGPLIGAAVVVFVQDYLRDVTDHVNLLYGMVVLLIALTAPGGLSGIAKSIVSGGFIRALMDRRRAVAETEHGRPDERLTRPADAARSEMDVTR